MESHPARGAWIEIPKYHIHWLHNRSRTPQGVRGLKLYALAGEDGAESRTPQGVRGLKFSATSETQELGQSHPARGAWIEIFNTFSIFNRVIVAPRKGCVD